MIQVKALLWDMHLLWITWKMYCPCFTVSLVAGSVGVASLCLGGHTVKSVSVFFWTGIWKKQWLFEDWLDIEEEGTNSGLLACLGIAISIVFFVFGVLFGLTFQTMKVYLAYRIHKVKEDVDKHKQLGIQWTVLGVAGLGCAGVAAAASASFWVPVALGVAAYGLWVGPHTIKQANSCAASLADIQEKVKAMGLDYIKAPP